MLSTTRSLCLAVAAVAVFAACSNGDSGSSGPASKPAAVATVPTNSAPPSTNAESQTFDGHGVTFQYPADWQPIKVSGSSASQGNQVWSESFGVDDGNLVLISRYTINIAITPSNIDQHSSELTTQIQSLYTQAGGSMQSGPTKLTMGGLPALGYSGTAVNPQAVSVKNRIVLAFSGKTEYLVNCQSTGQSSARIDPGCDQIISTFTVA